MVSIVFVVITLLLIASVIGFTAYRLIRRDLSSYYLVPDARKLFEENNPLRIDSAKLPTTVNGQEYTFSFWLYLSDFKPTSAHKLVFVRGARQTNGPLGGNPLVFMDASTNKLYIALSTNRLSLTSGSLPTLEQISRRAPEAKDTYVTAVVEYVPLQRWVNVAFVVKDRLLTVYVDGDMYTVESVADDVDLTSGARPILSTTQGDVVVGSMGSDTAAVAGYIGKLQFFNYGLTANDLRNVYHSGPRGSAVLSSLGMSEYALRTPIYRVDA
jgi:hypothetical protein